MALVLQDLLADAQCDVVGPFAQLSPALEAATTMRLDFALLDVNIGGVASFPLGDALQARGIPFIFLTGYDARVLPPNRQSWRVCSKPFRGDQLVATMIEELRSTNRGQS